MAQPAVVSPSSSTSTSSDAESSSWNFESETGGPLSSSYTSTNSFSDTDSCESSSSEDDQGYGRSFSPHVEKNMKRYIYTGAKVTYSESLLLLLRYSLVHALTKRALGDLLQLIALFLPFIEKSVLPTSVYMLKRAFVAAFPNIRVRKVLYCSTCQGLLDGRSSCGKGSCSGDVKDFTFISVSQQLKLKLEDKSIWKALQETYHKKVLCQSSNYVFDVYCGKEYRQHTFLMSPDNISLTLNTDGVAVFKSSNNSLWPIWLVINELPPTERYNCDTLSQTQDQKNPLLKFSRKNMILAALWFSNQKPTMSTLLKPVMEEMNDLLINGITVKTECGDRLVRAALLICSVDLPARSMCANMKQFNGKYGCIYCENPGTPRIHTPMVRDWPPRPGVLRTHDSILHNSQQAISTGEAVCGIKGASIFMMHRPFNMTKGFVVDDLHCVYLGVVKHLLAYWFGVQYNQYGFSIRSKIKLCDQRLASIRPPDVISRQIRSISEYAHWKGSEFKSWLLYYSMPVLRGILPSAYFAHYSLLVASLHILSSHCASTSDLDAVEVYLNTFYRSSVILYGDKFATMNVHMLSHLVESVRCWGPLWSYSCFSFEGMNGYIKTFFHGTREMNTQLAFCYTTIQNLQTDNIPVSFGRSSRLLKMQVGDTIKLIGKSKEEQLDNFIISSLQHTFNVTVTVGNVYQRCFVKDILYFSKCYTRTQKRNSFTVCFRYEEDTQFGEIEYFLCVSVFGSFKVYAYISQLLQKSSNKSHFELPHSALDSGVPRIFLVSAGPMVLVPVQFLLCKCVSVKLQSEQYLCIPPNMLLLD